MCCLCEPLDHLLQSQLEGAHAKWYFVHLNWSNEHFCYSHYIIITNSLCITLDTSNALIGLHTRKVFLKLANDWRWIIISSLQLTCRFIKYMVLKYTKQIINRSIQLHRRRGRNQKTTFKISMTVLCAKIRSG